MVRVVVCTVARPLVCTLSRGGCLGFGHGSVGDAVCIVIRWAAVQFVLRVRRHEVGTHEAHRWIVRFDRCPHDLL